MPNLPYADEVNYFKTGKSSVDTWVENTKKEIKSIGGVITSELVGTVNGQSAIMISFTLEDNWRGASPRQLLETLLLPEPKQQSLL